MLSNMRFMRQSQWNGLFWDCISSSVFILPDSILAYKVINRAKAIVLSRWFGKEDT